MLLAGQAFGGKSPKLRREGFMLSFKGVLKSMTIKDIISLLLQSDELEASAELSATFENMAKSIANRTENVEMLRYSLYTLSLLAINPTTSLVSIH